MILLYSIISPQMFCILPLNSLNIASGYTKAYVKKANDWTTAFLFLCSVSSLDFFHAILSSYRPRIFYYVPDTGFAQFFLVNNSMSRVTLSSSKRILCAFMDFPYPEDEVLQNANQGIRFHWPSSANVYLSGPLSLEYWTITFWYCVSSYILSKKILVFIQLVITLYGHL